MVKNLLKLIILCYFYISYGNSLERGDKCGVGELPGKCELFYDCINAMSNFENGIKPQICGFDGKMPIVCCTDFLSRFFIGTNNCNEYSLEELQSRFSVLNETFDSKKVSFSPSFREGIRRDIFNAVGGKLSKKEEFPHMAALGYGDKRAPKWMCGGTLISDQFVLTAAHCLTSRDMGPVKYIRLGDLNLFTDTDEARIQDFTVSKTYKHPGYMLPDKYHDIALIKLNRQAVFTNWVHPACLHHEKTIPNVTLIATGWGFTEEHGKPSDHLIKVELDLFSHEECKKLYKPQRGITKGIIEEYMFCAGGREHERGTCLGDSGGPIQIKTENIKGMYTVFGVTSFGRGCAVIGTAGVYMRISRYIPWIEYIVWS